MAWNLIIINNGKEYRCNEGSLKRKAGGKKFMTSKQRAYLKGLAMTIDPIFQIGKASVTPELTTAVAEALEAGELIKLSILKTVWTTAMR